MDIAAQYAKALSQIDKPSIVALRGVLERRGHRALMPRIYAEYAKLQERRERRERAQVVTPAEERTRVLLELYKKLTRSGGAEK